MASVWMLLLLSALFMAGLSLDTKLIKGKTVYVLLKFFVEYLLFVLFTKLGEIEEHGSKLILFTLITLFFTNLYFICG